MAEKSVPQNHLSVAHKWTTIHVLQKQLSICTHTVVITILEAWAVRAELQYSVKIEIQKRLALFRNPQSFVWKSRKGIMFLIDLESIQHKFSSDYSLDIYFSFRFPYIDSPSFSPYKHLQNVDFSKVGNMQFFQELYSHTDKNSGEKFEDMFLVKIASKGTSLRTGLKYAQMLWPR